MLVSVFKLQLIEDRRRRKTVTRIECRHFPSPSLVEPSLLLRRFRLRGFIEELVRGVVILDIPEVLSHGDDERSNNQNGNEGRVLALLGLDLLGRLEGGSGVVVCLLGDIDLVRSVNTLAGLLHGNDVGGREGGGGGSLGRWGGTEEHIGGESRRGEDRGGSLLHVDGRLGGYPGLGLCTTTATDVIKEAPMSLERYQRKIQRMASHK